MGIYEMKNMSRYLGRPAAFLSLSVPFLAACSGAGGGGISTAAAPAPLPVAPTMTTSGIAINLQAADTTVAYPAMATDTYKSGNPTVTVTSDASGNLKTVLFSLPSFSRSLGAPSLNLTSPLTVDA